MGYDHAVVYWRDNWGVEGGNAYEWEYFVEYGIGVWVEYTFDGSWE